MRFCSCALPNRVPARKPMRRFGVLDGNDVVSVHNEFCYGAYTNWSFDDIDFKKHLSQRANRVMYWALCTESIDEPLVDSMNEFLADLIRKKFPHKMIADMKPAVDALVRRIDAKEVLVRQGYPRDALQKLSAAAGNLAACTDAA